MTSEFLSKSVNDRREVNDNKNREKKEERVEGNDYRDLSKVKRTGEGTYGIVYTANLKGESIAIKRNIVDRTSDFTGCVRELDILNRLRGHPYIVKLIAISIGDPFLDKKSKLSPLRKKEYRNHKDDNIHFLFEHASYDGHSFIYEKDINYSKTKMVMLQILVALEYIHGKGIIHRDLKPSNLLIFENGSLKAKICDFGLSKPFTEQGDQSPRMSTYCYRAPEICLGETQYDKKIDIWSMGCIFFEMIAENSFLHGVPDNDLRVFINIMGKIPNLQISDRMSKLMKRKKIRLPAHIKSSRKNWSQLLSMTPYKISKFDQNCINHLTQNSNMSPNIIIDDNNEKNKIQNKEEDKINESEINESEINESENKEKEDKENDNEKKEDIQSDNFARFTHLLSKMLAVDSEERYSARECLEDPFFDSSRELIENIRKEYPPIENVIDLEPLNVIDCIERKWGAQTAFNLFNNREKIIWYKHRILFQAIDIYDRYLTYAFQHYPVGTEETETSGRLHTQYESELRFLVCLYISIKFFTTIYIPISFYDLASKEYKTQRAIKEAEEFEITLITEILKYSIYRETVFESADRHGDLLSEDKVRDLLMVYGMLTSYHGFNADQLYEMVKTAIN